MSLSLSLSLYIYIYMYERVRFRFRHQRVGVEKYPGSGTPAKPPEKPKHGTPHRFIRFPSTTSAQVLGQAPSSNGGEGVWAGPGTGSPHPETSKACQCYPYLPCSGQFFYQRVWTQFRQFCCRDLSNFTSEPDGRKIALQGSGRARGWVGGRGELPTPPHSHHSHCNILPSRPGEYCWERSALTLGGMPPRPSPGPRLLVCIPLPQGEKCPLVCQFVYQRVGIINNN